MIYDNIHEFHFKTNLTPARKEAIVDWVKSLPKDKQDMIEEMIHDAKAQEAYNQGEC